MRTSRWLFSFSVVVSSVATAIAQTPPAPPAAPAPPPYANILGPSPQTVGGMMTVHKKGEQLFAELSPGDYGASSSFFAISRGIGQSRSSAA